MITSRRQGNSSFLDSIVEKEEQATEKTAGMNKTASVEEKKPETEVKKTASVEEKKPEVKTANVEEKKPEVKTASTEKTTMSLFEMRQARRTGSFVKVAGKVDLYQNSATKDFWKISEDKKSVVRIFNEAPVK